MPPASDRRTSFCHDEAFSPTLRSTLPSRRAARGPGMPWWGAGLRGAVMSLLLVLCRRAGCHRRCLFVEGDRSAEHDINQIVFPFPRFTPNTGSSLGAQQFMHPLARSDSHRCTSKFYSRWLHGSFARQKSNTHRSTSMQVVARGSLLYGGGCTTNGEHWTPLPSLLSRLVKNRQWQIMNIYM